MPHQIVIADDEAALLRSVGYALRREGYEVDAVTDGAAALEHARTGSYDVAILDVMMPALSGLDVCREIRASSPLPVILLTARDTEVDTSSAAGADAVLDRVEAPARTSDATTVPSPAA